MEFGYICVGAQVQRGVGCLKGELVSLMPVMRELWLKQKLVVSYLFKAIKYGRSFCSVSNGSGLLQYEYHTP